jgi:hypothetical protein
MGLALGTAFAQSVTAPYYIVVQPIDVCNSAGTSCAPVNNMGQTIISPGGGPNMKVGWFDPTSGANISPAILLHGMNANVVFMPLRQYNSAPNCFSPNPSPPPDFIPSTCVSPPPTGGWNTDFRTLHVKPCSTCATGITSPDLGVLAQEPAITTGTVPNPTTPPGGSTACTVDMTNGNLQAPCVPVSTTATVIDWFLVNNLVPTTPGQLYGITWKIGFNGIATAANAMVGVPTLGLLARPDTLIHEGGHVLGGDHPVFGAGPYNPYGPSNLEGGTVPPIPANPFVGECDAKYPACMANLLTAGGGVNANGVQVNLRTEPTVANALSMLAAGTADQMTTAAQEGPNLPVSQQTALLGSGFINVVPNSMLTATKPVSGAASVATASVAAKSTASGTSGTSGASSSILFTASGPEPPENTNVIVIMLLSPFKFDPNNPFKIVPPGNSLLQDADYVPDADNAPNNPNAPYHLGAAYKACTPSETNRHPQCLIVEFNAPGLGAGSTFQFTQGILNGTVPATLQQLQGSVITFGLSNTSPTGTVTSSQYITTSQLTFDSATGQDTASSQTTSPTLPPPVLGNPGAFAGSGNMACTPVYDANSNLICQDFFAAGTVDSVPCDEGGQQPGTCP